jgi:phasin family protein
MAENADEPSESAEKAYAAASAAVPARAEPARPVVSHKVATPAAKKPLPTATEAEPTTPKPTITELKDKIMATAKSTDFSKTVTDTVGEFQRRAKEAYDKGAELSAEATEFAKGNVEALVESGKILAAGVQDLGKSYAEDAKSAYETATADLKEFAAVKSPTELFQLQGKLLRRNFETLFAYGSKNTEAVVKLASESFAPLSSRASLAAEKLSKVA